MRGLALSPDNNLYISNCWTHSILRLHKNSGDTGLLADRKYSLFPNVGLFFENIFKFFEFF